MVIILALVIVAFAMIGSFIFWIVGLVGGNSLATAVANGAFFLFLMGYAASRPRRLTPGAVIAASISATLLLAMCAIAGTLVFDRSHALGDVLMSAVSVGRFPPGADVPLLPGFGIWAASCMAVTLAGLFSGAFLRRHLHKREVRHRSDVS